MSYRLLKDSGNNSISVENTELNKTCSIGIATPTIRQILADSGLVLNIADKWEVEITKETATQLQKTTFRMRKPPVRVIKQQEHTTEDTKATPVQANVDMFDLLFGIN